MANATLTKGSAVEVSSDEPGFHGAWYAATFVDEVEAAPTRKRASNKKNRNAKRIRYLVKYDTLFEDDNFLEPLTEVVDSSFVRPLPPPNIRRNNGDNATEAEVVEEEEGGDFELYDVVDACHRDGWWMGVVKNVIIEGEMSKYIVQFENPPEEFEFERSKLRFHVDWVDCRWLVPPKKTPEQELGDRNATHTSDDAHSGLTTPSKGAQITDVENSPPRSAKKNSRSRKRFGSNSASVTYSRKKRSVNSVAEDSCGKRFQSSAGSKGNTKVIASVLETSGSDVLHQDSPPVGHRIIITQTRESENGKRGRSPKLVRRLTGLLEGGHEITTDIDEQPLSVWYQGMHPHSVLKRSSCFSPPHNQDNPLSPGTTTDWQKGWPFIKRSPIWATIGLHLTPPQKPHFSPLKKMKEDYREGFAIAHMVTYLNLVQRLSDLQLNDPVDVINNSLETLCDLEAHGFDVGWVRARFNELRSLKSKAGQDEDKLRKVEKELGERNHERSVLEKEVDELNVKMQELQEKMVRAVAMQKAKEEQIRRLRTNLHLVSNKIKDSELAFEKLVATPL